MDLIEFDHAGSKAPPIDRLGAFPPWTDFSRKMIVLNWPMLLNNFLASPSFQTWMEGATLDVEALALHTFRPAAATVFFIWLI